MSRASKRVVPAGAGTAALVADGLSNAAIAGWLTLSLRTGERHVNHVLHTLDLTSRAGIASWHVPGSLRTVPEPRMPKVVTGDRRPVPHGHDC